jgi:hypothetical protein
MKKMFAVVTIAGLAGLTACAPASNPAPEGPPTSAATSATPLASPVASESASGVREACEKFNSLYVQYRAAGDDHNAHEDVYFAAADAKDTVSGNLVGLFTSMMVLALDTSSEIETGTPVEQATKDAIRDAVFANSQACTAEGVTLTL